MPRSIPLITAALCGACFASALRADPPFTFTKIADINTTIPDSGGKKFQALGLPSRSGSRIAFGGSGEGIQGIYEWNNNTLARIADTTTAIPNASGNFTGLGNGDISGEHVVFGGLNGGGVSGLYRRSNGQISRVVDNQMTAPNGGLFTGAGAPSVEGGSAVAFYANHIVSQNLLPSVYRWDSGTITTVADTSTAVPGGTGNFSSLTSSSIRLHNNATWFHGLDAAGKSGIYKRDSNGLQAVIDTNTNGPAGMGKFKTLVEFDSDGEDVLFRGATEIGNPVTGGLFQRLGGQITKLASTGDAAPGGGTFEIFTQLSFQNGIAVFAGANQSVLYTNVGGTIQRIIGFGDTLDGKAVNNVYFTPNGRDGLNLAIGITFQGVGPSDQAIYTVTIPAPPSALLPFAGAAVLAAGRRR